MAGRTAMRMCLAAAAAVFLIGAFPDPADARCLAANQWAWGSCGGSGSRGGGGGGGGNNYAAAVGAANVAIGFLNMAIAAAEEQQRQERNAAANARHAACQAKYRDAYATNERARRLVENGRPEEAFDLFERALSTLGSCGQRADLGKLRGNLASARQQFASLVNPDVADTTIYGKTATGPAKLAPALLERQAREACKSLAQDAPAWNACVAARKGELVIASDPSIRNACQSIADRATRQQCIFNRYWAANQGKDEKEFGDNSNCYYDEHGKPCHPGGGRAVAAKTQPQGESELRKELRRRLNALPDRLPSKEDIGNMEAARDALPPGADRDQMTAAIDQAKAGEANGDGKSLNDQAYDNFMQGRDGNLGQGVDVGVPENGSFANDFGGDKLLGSSVPSSR